MKILIVAKQKSGTFSPFITEQVSSIRQFGIDIDYYGIEGKGIRGYLKSIPTLISKINSFKPDLIHAHYGLSGFLANIQRKIPVITTYHGSDIHSGGWVSRISKITMRLSAFNIVVSKRLLEISKYKGGNICIQPCGINLDKISSIPIEIARESLNIPIDEKICLFSSAFDNEVKNFPLAQNAVKKIPHLGIRELKGFSREEVVYMINSANLLIMTSFNEGSPQVIKEAMACGTPIVSVNVGDVKDILGKTEGCYIAESNPDDLADKITKALSFNRKTSGRQRIFELGLDNRTVAKNIIDIYRQVIGK